MDRPEKKIKNSAGENIPSVRTFPERFHSSKANKTVPVQINTDSILVFPELEREYVILDPLNAGGNAVISIAEDKFLKRRVALKSLRKELQDDPVKKRAFIREAQIMAQLEHPGIVPVYGIAKDLTGGLHIIMKQIRGKSLKDLLKNLREKYAGNKLSRQKEKKLLIYRLELYIRLCDAVAFAHSKNVLHGDLKPGNIMIENNHDVYVMDWGNSEIVRKPHSECILKDTISGTPSYLSPEAVRGECTDFRSEVFTLGLILFETVTLSKAVAGKNSKEILTNLRDGKRNPIRHRYGMRISPVLRGIIKKAIHPEKEKRYQSVAIFAEELRNALPNLFD